MKRVMFFVFIINIYLWASCWTFRVYTRGDPPPRVSWVVQWQDPFTGAWSAPVPAKAVIPTPNVYDREVSSPPNPAPWSKLYSFPDVQWISLTSSAAESVCVPGPTHSCVYRYIYGNFSLDDTVTRATMWYAVDDVVAAGWLINLSGGPNVPLPIVGSGFGRLTRIDLTDIFRRDVIPGDVYELVIYVKDTKPGFTGLLLYLSWDEDDDEQLYTYNIPGAGTYYISMPFYAEVPPGTPLSTIFPTATNVTFHLPCSSPISMAPGAVTLDGTTGDWLRTYTTEITFSAGGTFSVRGTSIWEQRYLDIDCNNALYFGTADDDISWPLDNSPDDYPNNKILRSRTWEDASPPPTLTVRPTHGYWTYPMPLANSLPYSLDLIVTPHCSGFSASHTSIGGIPSDWSPPPVTEAEEISVRACTLDSPDTLELRNYLDSLRVWELIDYFPRVTPTPKINIPSVESAINVVAASGAINISLSIPARTDVEIDIYDASGRLVKNIKGSSSGNGKFIYNWDGLANDGTECSPGVYLIRVKYGDTILTRKAILVR